MIRAVDKTAARLGLGYLGTALAVDEFVECMFEYNIALTEKLYVTPSAGLNFSAYLNSEQRYFQFSFTKEVVTKQ